jgi:hypothetical protein
VIPLKPQCNALRITDKRSRLFSIELSLGALTLRNPHLFQNMVNILKECVPLWSLSLCIKATAGLTLRMFILETNAGRI